MTTAMHAGEITAQMGAKTVEAWSACADASQKLLRELVELSTTTAKEGVRLHGELQASAVEAAKDGHAFLLSRKGALQDSPLDPMAMCQQALLDSAEAAQRTFRMVEGNAQAIARATERLQVTAAEAAKEIQTTVGQLAGRVKSIYAA